MGTRPASGNRTLHHQFCSSSLRKKTGKSPFFLSRIASCMTCLQRSEPLSRATQVKSDKSNTYGDNVVSNIIRAKAKAPAATQTRKSGPARPATATRKPRVSRPLGERVPTSAAAPKSAPVNPAPMAQPAAAAVAPTVRRLVIDEASAGQRLDNFLLRELKGVPKTHVYRVIRAGEVRVNKGRAQADTRLEMGDEVRIPPVRLPERVEAKTEFVPPREFPVIYEDDYLLAINKPAGVAVHGGSGVSFGVIEQLRQARPTAKFLELVHRLDKETSGLLLIAKKRGALVALQDQFRERETGKTYAALVGGEWAANKKVIDVPLLKFIGSDGERWVRAVTDPKDVHADQAKRSISLVRVAERLGEHSLLDVTIKTGRTHQIRVHLAHEGHAIVGDPKYGDFEANRALARGPLRFDRMFLHAKRLRFIHPSEGGKEMELLAPLPAECQQLIQALQNQGKGQGRSS